jgi:hypothetical protein
MALRVLLGLVGAGVGRLVMVLVAVVIASPFLAGGMLTGRRRSAG